MIVQTETRPAALVRARLVVDQDSDPVDLGELLRAGHQLVGAANLDAVAEVLPTVLPGVLAADDDAPHPFGLEPAR